MIRIPIDPYWSNAIQNWIASRSDIAMTDRSEEIRLWHSWLQEQGVLVYHGSGFQPYLEFTCDSQATAFMLRWA